MLMRSQFIAQAQASKKAKIKLNVDVSSKEQDVADISAATLSLTTPIETPLLSAVNLRADMMDLDTASTCTGNTAHLPEDKKGSGRQKAVAKVKTSPETNTHGSLNEASAPKVNNGITKMTSKSTTKEVLSADEKEKRERLVRNELMMISEIKVYGDFIPMLRPTAEELRELDELADNDGPVPIKIRQLLSRFIEGRDQEIGFLIEYLEQTIQSGEASEKTVVVSRISSVLSELAEAVDCRPHLQSFGEILDLSFVRRLAVKDMADIPEKFRSIVDVHRKMESALKERMVHLSEIIKELSGSGKCLGKLDKALVGMKDRYAKLEEREKKEKDKLEVKLEAGTFACAVHSYIY
jgi:hypothetical protein